MHHASRPRPRLAAFTLVELLVVIGIIALLISILLPSLQAARKTAQDVQCASNLRQISTALVMYATEQKGAFPPNINTLIPAPITSPGGSPKPTANLWYDVDRIGQYLPEGEKPSATSPNPTIGGTVMICPRDFDQTKRAYAMNMWASSKMNQDALNRSPQRLTYKANYVPAATFRGTFWKSGQGGSDYILVGEAHARNTVPAGYYANSTMGLQGDFPGQRFLGIPGYTIGSGNFGGGPYPRADATTEMAFYKHAKDEDGNVATPDGRANIGFADGHVEIFKNTDLAEELTNGQKVSTLRALWSPYDRELTASQPKT